MTETFFDKQDWRTRIMIMVVVFTLAFSWFMFENIGGLNQMPVINQALIPLAMYTAGALVVGLGLRDGLKGILGTISVLAGVDLMIPPYVVSTSGEVASTVDLAGSGIEVLFHQIWTGFGVPASQAWWFVYPISFILLMGIGVFTLSKTDFKDAVV